MDKKIIILAMIFGSTIGGFIPTLFGANAFGLTSVFCGAIGGIIGIWLSFRFLN
jgi:hypothetical protein